MIKIVILGANGQLGKELESSLSSNFKTFPISKNDADITNFSVIRNKLKEIDPSFVINAAAYTKVDEAEDFKDLAFEVNAYAVKNLAKLSNELNFTLFHFSTDYIFNQKMNIPIREDHEVDPQNVYGLSKLKGEEFIQQIAINYFIFRVSWVYGKYGNNFPKTILNLAKDKEEINVVNDQIGCPTPTNLISQVIRKIIDSTFHKETMDISRVLNISPNGECSWFDIAQEILLHTQKFPNLYNLKSVKPVSSSEFPSKAKRPNYSYLSCEKLDDQIKINRMHWKVYLNEFLEDLTCEKNN